MRVLDDGLALQHLSDLTFIYCLACVVEFEFVPTASHAENLEAVDFWDESWSWTDLIVEVLYKQIW